MWISRRQNALQNTISALIQNTAQSKFLCNTDVRRWSFWPTCNQIMIVHQCHLKLSSYIVRSPDSTPAKAALLSTCNIHDVIPPAPDLQTISRLTNNLASPHISHVQLSASQAITDAQDGQHGHHRLQPPRLRANNNDDDYINQWTPAELSLSLVRFNIPLDT